jgi:c-di-GMP-binding flagellar brake protein YcgR
MDKIPERRKHIRIKTPYITRFRVKPYDDMVSKDLDTVTVFNLSAGGIFFYSSINLEVGTILYLKIGVSRSHPSIICVGKVLRAKRHQAISINGYSIEFTEIDEQIKQMINKSLEIRGWQRKL